MNAALVSAGALTVVIGIVHSLLGEKYLLIRLFRRTDLPKLLGSDVFTKRILRFAWHITSIAWWGFAALLFRASAQQEPDVTALRIVSATFLASALASGLGSRGRHYSWIVFLAIALLAMLAA